jgi:hypothetical protein
MAKSLVAVSFFLSFALLGTARATTAQDALAAGAQIVAVAAFPDGTIVLTLQKDKAAVMCVMDKASGTTISSRQCYAIR